MLPTLLTILAAIGMAVFAVSSPNVRDALLKLTRALPASTSAVTTAAAIDTGVADSNAIQPGDVEYLLSAPLVTTAQLPDTKTFVYSIISSPNSDLSSPTTRINSAITQTGAGAAGAAAATYRFRMASDWGRYIGFVVTPSASGTGDASAASATLELLV